MAILNYTTSINAVKTAGEVQAALARHGASSVSVIYDQGEPQVVAFSIDTEFGMRNFQLPANAQGVLAVLTAQLKARKVERRYVTAEQAQRVAWRILKDWIVAQLAIIEAGMASLDEVMLPYMLTNTGVTLSQAYKSMPAMRNALEASPSEGAS